MTHCSQLRLNIGGNFILHDPRYPDFATDAPKLKEAVSAGNGLEQTSKAAPRILRDAQARVIRFFSDPMMLPHLNHVAATQQNMKNGNKYTKPRQMSSAGREACIRVAIVLITYCELASMRIGKQTPTAFEPIGVKRIAKDARVSLRRCERVLQRFRDVRFMSTYQRSTKVTEDEYKGEIAVRRLEDSFFIALGIQPRYLAKAKQAAYQRIKGMVRRTPNLISSIMQAATRHKPKQGDVFKGLRRRRVENLDEKINRVAMALMSDNHLLSFDDARHEAALAFKSRG